MIMVVSLMETQISRLALFKLPLIIEFFNGRNGTARFAAGYRLQTRKKYCFIILQQNENFEHSSPNGWLYQRRPYWIPVFGNTTQEYFTVLPNGNWQHLYHVNKVI